MIVRSNFKSEVRHFNRLILDLRSHTLTIFEQIVVIHD